MSTKPTGRRPSEWVAEACALFGTREVALRCVALLEGADDPELLPFLGGPAANLPSDRLFYWPRVWAARGLRYAWDDRAVPTVVAALSDPAWRVREMAAKVALQYELGQAAVALAALRDDPVPRVRAAAAAALGQVGEFEQAAALRIFSEDVESTVRQRAVRSLRLLAKRLDRPDAVER